MERRYQMTRLGKGDYLCPSNDLSEMWRFHSHEDGKVHGLECDFECRTFWRATRMPMEAFKRLSAGGEVPGAWADVWSAADWFLPSRAACIAKMLASVPLSR